MKTPISLESSRLDSMHINSSVRGGSVVKQHNLDI
jgi:hypothetical protein